MKSNWPSRERDRHNKKPPYGGWQRSSVKKNWGKNKTKRMKKARKE